MYGLQTLHRLNNTADYQLTEQEISCIMRDPMFPAHMAVEANLMHYPDPIPASERVRLWKALKVVNR